MDGSFMYVDPPASVDQHLAKEEITLDNRGWVAYHWTSSRHNVHLDSEDVATAELHRFIAAGGRTVVDPTNKGLGRDPEPLVRIAKATGAHIIVGAGYYLGGTHPDDMSDRATDSIADEIVADIQIGIENRNATQATVNQRLIRYVPSAQTSPLAYKQG